MSQAFDVCIRGAGIVGRSLALCLAQQRLRVGLVSAPAAPATGLPPDASAPAGARPADNRAYALNAASKQMLQDLRCWPEGPSVTPVSAMRVWGDDAAVLNFAADGLPKGGSRHHAEALAWIVDVAELEASLDSALRFQPRVERLDAPQAATLTVVCEGRMSSTRDEFGVDFEVTPYGQQAIAARLDCSKPHQGRALQWFSNGEVMALLPLGGPQGNSAALVWSVPDERAQRLCALAPDEFASAVQAASASVLGQMSLSGDLSRWPLQQALARRWSGTDASGRAWVLAGDAAHTVHPLGGQGLNLGLADVAELAQVLGARDYWRGIDDARLLRRYERARRSGLAPVGAVMDGLQRLFGAEQVPLKRLRNLGMQGVERSAALKAWVVRQAMGAAGRTERTGAAESA